jgi:hypothetical protein
MARSLVQQGARLLLVATSDVAMRHSALPLHHARFAVYRAVENRRWLIQASNGGPSMIVSPYGDVSTETPLLTRTVFAGRVAMRRTRSVYTRVGDWPLLGFAALVVASAGWYGRRPGRRRWARGAGRALAVGPLLATTAGACIALASVCLVTRDRPDLATSWVDAVRTLLRAAPVAVPHDAGREFLQTRENTCGPAALAYALGLFGTDVTERDLLPGLDVHADGTSMAELAAAARRQGFTAWGEGQNLPALRAAPKPVLAHVREDHYVVVLAFEGDWIDLFDPATGFVQMSVTEFGRTWRGNVLVIRPRPLEAADGEPARYSRVLAE